MTWTTRQRSKSAGRAAIVAGSGPQILLLHGVGLRAEAWGAQIDALAPSFRVIAPDMPGHGESDMTAQTLSLSDYTDAALSHVEGPVLVVGHSMGAMMALDMAHRYPDRVRGVIALNAIFERSEDAKCAVQSRAAELDGVSLTDPDVTLTRWFGSEPSAERDACADWLRNANPAGYKMAYTIFAHSDGPSRTALASLPCPALFITGSEEPNSTPAMSQTMAALAPNGHAKVIKDAAHMMPMTHAAEVNAAITTFAQEVLT